MKKLPIILLICSSAAGLFAQEKNLVKNGSFEIKNAKGLPVGWNVPKNAKLIADCTDGKNALAFNGTITNYHFPLPPGQYTLRFNVKKDNKNWLGIRILCMDQNNKIINSDKLSKYYGMKETYPDWTPIEFHAEVPETSKGKSYLIFGSHGGLVYIDDIRLTKVDANKTDGVLVFQDSFDRSELGKDYIVDAGKWEIKDGALYAKQAEAYNLVKFARSFGRNLRLEYTCYSRTPEDLSAMLAVQPQKKGMSGYAFGFAANYNSYNYIASTNPFRILTRTITEGFCTGAMPSRKHKIIVEKREGDLKFYRDGKLELAANDAFSDDQTGQSFGFFTYNTGYFDDLKVYRLPESKRTTLKPEYPVKEIIFIDKFDKPEEFAGGKAKQIIVPTWEYENTKEKNQYLVQDPCLEASDVSLKLPNADYGMVEFDIQAKDYKDIFVDLIDAKGKTAATFIIDKKGTFHADGGDGKIPLLQEIEYRRRSTYDTLSIDPRKWYTFRIKYNSADRIVDTFALIEYYTEQNGFDRAQAIKQGDYVSLGGKLPMKKDAGKPVAVRFRTAKGNFNLDNYLAFGPVGFKSVKGKSILYSGTKLLNLKHQQRRDPMLLKVQSLRNLDNQNSFRTPTHVQYGLGLGKVTFHKWGRKYNELMLSMAFLQECIQIIERQNFYQGKKITLDALRKEFQQAEDLQEKALVAFANAFWNKQDDNMLKSQAEPALNKFDAAYSALRKKILAVNPAMKHIPAAPIYNKWEMKYDRKLKRWTDKDGKPQAFFTSTPQAKRSHLDGIQATEHILDKVRAIGVQPATSTIHGLSGRPKDGEYFDYSWFETTVKNSRNLRDKHNLIPCGVTSLNVGVGPMRMSVPKWWLDKYKVDKDIYYTLPDGTPGDKITPVALGWPLMPFLALNFWNPHVQDYLATRHRILGEKLSKHQDLYDNMLFYFGGEATLSPGNGMIPGYAKSAVKAFRKRLLDKYGTIQELNRKWETAYKSFDEIKPPQPGAEPSPLRYEFNTFVNEDYFNVFLGGVKRSLEKGYGKSLAIGHDMQDTFSFFDMPAFFDNVAIALFHSYRIWDRKIYPKYLRSLSEATGTPWGAMEWGSPQGSKTMFNMEEERLHVLQDLSHQLMSGCIAPNLFSEQMYAGTSDWQYGFTPNDHRIGFLAFNYHAAPALRVSKDRSMRFGEIALRAKSITPDIAVLEVDSSRQNALPDRSIFNMCKDFAIEMENQSAHYGVLFEKLVIDGRQKLNDIPMIFIPNGICMKESLDKKLEEYLINGGTIVAFAPPGVYNEYAKAKSGGIITKAFPGVKWTHNNYATWYANGKTQTFWQGKLGKGTIYVFNAPANFNGNSAKFLALMKKHINPRIICSNNKIQHSYLEYNGCRYLYVLNSSITAAETAEISLAGKFAVTDIGMPESQKVPAVNKNGRTVFKIRLAPSEMTLFKLTK